MRPGQIGGQRLSRLTLGCRTRLRGACLGHRLLALLFGFGLRAGHVRGDRLAGLPLGGRARLGSLPKRFVLGLDAGDFPRAGLACLALGDGTSLGECGFANRLCVRMGRALIGSGDYLVSRTIEGRAEIEHVVVFSLRHGCGGWCGRRGVDAGCELYVETELTHQLIDLGGNG